MTQESWDTGRLRHVKLSRTLGRSLCATLERVFVDATSTGVLGLLLDFDSIRKLKWSELAALVEFSAKNVRNLTMGIVATAPVRAQLEEFGADRFISMLSSVQDVSTTTAFRRVIFKDVEAVILAQSAVPLLGPLIQDMPAVLLPVGGTTPLKRALDHVAELGLQNVTICLGDCAEKIRDAVHCCAPPGLQIRFNREHGADQSHQWSSVMDAFDQGFGWSGSAYVVDPLILAGTRPIQPLSDVTMAGKSIASIEGANACFALAVSRMGLAASQSFGNVSIATVAKRLARQLPKEQCAKATTETINLGTPFGFFQAQAKMGGMDGCDGPGFRKWDNGALVHRSSRIHPSAVLSSQTVIGPVVDVGPGCVFKGQVVIERGSKILNHTLVEDTWVAPQSVVPAASWISTMLVGANWALDYTKAKSLPLNLTPLSDMQMIMPPMSQQHPRVRRA